jgi:hypothetical protein
MGTVRLRFRGKRPVMNKGKSSGLFRQHGNGCGSDLGEVIQQ